MIEVATDNKTHTTADIRSAISENHGRPGVPGCVPYMSQRKGKLAVSSTSISEDKFLNINIDAGSEDLEQDNKQFPITTPADQLYHVAETLRNSSSGSAVQSMTWMMS